MRDDWDGGNSPQLDPEKRTAAPPQNEPSPTVEKALFLPMHQEKVEGPCKVLPMHRGLLPFVPKKDTTLLP